MNKAIFMLLALAAVQASATVVNICGTGGRFKSPDVDATSVTVSDCTKPPCPVSKGQQIGYSLKFTPNSIIDDLTAQVKASRMGLSHMLLDGASVCDKIFTVSDDSPAPCPLSPGVEYIYRDAVDVPKMIPVRSGVVQLAIKSGSKTIKCFEAPVELH